MCTFINLLSNIKQQHGGIKIFFFHGSLVAITKERLQMRAKYRIEVRL